MALNDVKIKIKRVRFILGLFLGIMIFVVSEYLNIRKIYRLIIESLLFISSSYCFLYNSFIIKSFSKDAKDQILLNDSIEIKKNGELILEKK